MKKATKTIVIISSILGGLIVISAGAIGIMSACSYKPDEIALGLLKDDHVKKIGNNILVESSHPSDKGIVFYPGAMVPVESYLPLMKKVAEYDINCYLLDMPLNFAFFGAEKANDAFIDVPGVSSWYVAGHSLGGTIASSYANKHADKIQGLILLGSYPYKDYPLEKTLTIYGTLDSLATKHVDYETNVYKIEGGNHCYFGNYGQQKGDAIATIEREEQQRISASTINSFVNC